MFWFGIDTKTVDIASIQGGFPPFHIQYTIQSGNLSFNMQWLWLELD
jgi:hypothetical protein